MLQYLVETDNVVQKKIHFSGLVVLTDKYMYNMYLSLHQVYCNAPVICNPGYPTAWE